MKIVALQTFHMKIAIFENSENMWYKQFELLLWMSLLRDLNFQL